MLSKMILVTALLEYLDNLIIIAVNMCKLPVPGYIFNIDKEKKF